MCRGLERQIRKQRQRAFAVAGRVGELAGAVRGSRCEHEPRARRAGRDRVRCRRANGHVRTHRGRARARCRADRRIPGSASAPVSRRSAIQSLAAWSEKRSSASRPAVAAARAASGAAVPSPSRNAVPGLVGDDLRGRAGAVEGVAELAVQLRGAGPRRDSRTRPRAAADAGSAPRSTRRVSSSSAPARLPPGTARGPRRGTGGRAPRARSRRRTRPRGRARRATAVRTTRSAMRSARAGCSRSRATRRAPARARLHARATGCRPPRRGSRQRPCSRLPPIRPTPSRRRRWLRSPEVRAGRARAPRTRGRRGRPSSAGSCTTSAPGTPARVASRLSRSRSSSDAWCRSSTMQTTGASSRAVRASTAAIASATTAGSTSASPPLVNPVARSSAPPGAEPATLTSSVTPPASRPRSRSHDATTRTSPRAGEQAARRTLLPACSSCDAAASTSQLLPVPGGAVTRTASSSSASAPSRAERVSRASSGSRPEVPRPEPRAAFGRFRRGEVDHARAVRRRGPAPDGAEPRRRRGPAARSRATSRPVGARDRRRCTRAAGPGSTRGRWPRRRHPPVR